MGSDLQPQTPASVRTFGTGATRDLDANKLDFEGFLSPLVVERYAQHMHKARKMADGSMRASDNWQLGIPGAAYMKSLPVGKPLSSTCGRLTEATRQPATSRRSCVGCCSTRTACCTKS